MMNLEIPWSSRWIKPDSKVDMNKFVESDSGSEKDDANDDTDYAISACCSKG